jgi:hypothetical protein
MASAVHSISGGAGELGLVKEQETVLRRQDRGKGTARWCTLDKVIDQGGYGLPLSGTHPAMWTGRLDVIGE